MHLYDPVFLMLIFGQKLADSEQPQSSSFSWLKFLGPILFCCLFESYYQKMAGCVSSPCVSLSLYGNTNLVSFGKPRYKRGPTQCIFLTCRKTIFEHILMSLPIYYHHIRTLILMHALKGIFLSFELHICRYCSFSSSTSGAWHVGCGHGLFDALQ